MIAASGTWQCEVAKALREEDPSNIIKNIWERYGLKQEDYAQFTVYLSSAILDRYRQNPGEADKLMEKAKLCFIRIAGCTGWKRRGLPDPLEFAFTRLKARLYPNNSAKVFPWLRLCYDVGNKDAAHYFSLFGFDRDEEMRQLVFDEDETKVRPYFMEDQSSRLHLRKIADWFLRQYDLPRALQLFWHLNSFFSSRARVARITIRLFPTFFVLLFIIGGFLWKFWLPPEKVLWYGLLVVVIGSSLALVLFKNVLLPRLLAGIAIGYLFLLPGKDFWEFAVSQKADATLQIWLLAGLTLFASWLYLLYGEVKRIVIKSGEAKKRALLIFIIGLSQSIAIGFILSGLLAPPLARWQNWEGLVKAGECFGIPFGIFPMAFVFQVPVAFFVGILSQILWEDKPVTEPL